LDNIVVASPEKIPFKNADFFIGDENDVLGRYYNCAIIEKADIIIRITADCPLIDPEIIDYAIKYYKKHDFPYVYFAPVDGLDVEVFSFKMLEKTWLEATSFEDREHVTPFMKRFTKISIDTQEDFEKVKNGMVK